MFPITHYILIYYKKHEIRIEGWLDMGVTQPHGHHITSNEGRPDRRYPIREMATQDRLYSTHFTYTEWGGWWVHDNSLNTVTRNIGLPNTSLSDKVTFLEITPALTSGTKALTCTEFLKNNKLLEKLGHHPSHNMLAKKSLYMYSSQEMVARSICHSISIKPPKI